MEAASRRPKREDASPKNGTKPPGSFRSAPALLGQRRPAAVLGHSRLRFAPRRLCREVRARRGAEQRGLHPCAGAGAADLRVLPCPRARLERPRRTEEGLAGNECGSTGRFGWAPCKNKTK